MQDPRIFRAQLVVGEDDIDVLEHASNIAFVRWIQDVAVAHSIALGLSFDVFRRVGGVFVIARHEIDYLRPVLRGEELEARTWISGLMAAKCLRVTELLRAPNREAVARALTTWAFVERETGRPARMPGEVRASLEGALRPG